MTNRCKEKDGQWNEAKGIAEAQQPGSTDKLWVRFDNWFSRLAPGLTKGEYWVLYHDKDYRVALVGHPTASTCGCFHARLRSPTSSASNC